MDCDNMESGTVSIALYPKKGNLIENTTAYEIKVEPAIPSTADWNMVKVVCDIYNNGY